ncbi:hypothetical protein ACFE04_015098 [Oxalis oulophora]
MEGLSVSAANLTVYVHPSKCDRVPQAILRELSNLLFKYNEVFDGVILAYYDVDTLDETAKILPGIHPYFGVKVKSKFLVFSPKPDMLLEGKVVKVTQESIHIVVLGFASAVINTEDIRHKFKYRIKHGEERFTCRTNKHHTIKVGTMIRFLVQSLDEEILHMSASLLPSNTGSIKWLDKNSEDVSLTDQSKKKKREIEGETKSEDHGVEVNNNNDQPKKSVKSRTHKLQVGHSLRLEVQDVGNAAKVVQHLVTPTR